MANINQKKSGKKQGKDGFRPKKQGMQSKVDGAPFREDLDKKDSTKQERRGAEYVDTGVKMSDGNPVSIYKKFDKYATDAANLPFALPVGSAVHVSYHVGGVSETDNTTTVKSDFVVPGIAALYFTPTLGVSNNFNSAINRSSIRFYTYLRSNQKASGTYDHQDVSMMELSLDSCYMFHALLSRVYGIVNGFTPVNEYYSRSTVAACRVDFEDIRKNLQDFRAFINSFAYNLGQYALPNNLELFFRHRWMCEGMYTDGDTTKAQTYMFVPSLFWKYDNTVATGSELTPVYWYTRTAPNKYWKYDEIVSLGMQLLNAVSNDNDFSIISGDIYNFYGGDVYKLPYIDESYAIVPTYDKTVLSQIENCVICGDLRDTTEYPLKVTQNPSVNEGAIIFQPVAYIKNGIFPNECTMNFHWDDVKPDDVIEATRLLPVADLEDHSHDWVVISQCGTEIVNSMAIITRNASTLASEVYWYQSGGMMLDLTNTSPDLNMEVVKKIGLLAQFDWAPQQSLVVRTGTTAAPIYNRLGSTWDIDNFDVVPQNYISNIHNACLLSLFTTEVNRE